MKAINWPKLVVIRKLTFSNSGSRLKSILASEHASLPAVCQLTAAAWTTLSPRPSVVETTCYIYLVCTRGQQTYYIFLLIVWMAHRDYTFIATSFVTVLFHKYYPIFLKVPLGSWKN